MTKPVSSTDNMYATTSANAQQKERLKKAVFHPLNSSANDSASPFQVAHLNGNVPTEFQFTASSLPGTLHFSHSEFEAAPFIHLKGEAMEYASKFFASSEIPGKLEKLKKPITINGQTCTHRQGPIFGSESSVKKIVESIENIGKQKGFKNAHKLISQNLKKGRAAVVAIDGSNALKNIEGLGSWGKFNTSFLEFQVAISIDVENIGKWAGRSIEGVSAHEWIHELISLNAEKRGGIPFKANPCVNPEQAQRLGNKWSRAFEEFKNGRHTGNAAKAGEFFFGATEIYYKEFNTAYSKVESLIKQVKSTTDPLKKAKIEKMLFDAIEKAEKAGDLFFSEIPSHFMEAKMNADCGHKAMKKIAKEVGRELDELYGQKIFLEAAPEIAKRRFWKAALHKAGKVLGRIALAVDITEEMLCAPRKVGSFSEHIVQSVNVECSKFALQTLLWPVYTAALVEHFLPEQEKKTPEQINRHFEHTAFIMSGGRTLFKESNQRPSEEMSEMQDKPFHAFLNQLEKEVAKAVKWIPSIAFAAQLVDKYLISPRVIENPEQFVSIIRKATEEFSKDFEFPSDFQAWSAEKQAQWAQEIGKRSRDCMEKALSKFEEQSKIENVVRENIISNEYFSRVDLKSSEIDIDFSGEQGEKIDACLKSFEEKAADFISNLPQMPEIPENMTLEEILKVIEQLDPEEPQKIENVHVSGEKTKKELEAEWKSEERKEKIVDVLECIEGIASEIYHDRQRSVARAKNKISTKRWERDHGRRLDQLKEKHEKNPVSLSMIQRGVMSAVHPAGTISQQLDAMKKVAQDYRKAQSELKELIEVRQNRQITLDAQKGSLEQLDRRIKRHYKKIIESRSKTIKILEKVSTALNIAANVLKPFPIASIACKTAATATSIAETEVQKTCTKTQDNYQRKMEGNLSIHERLASLSSNNHYEMTGLAQERARQRTFLMNASEMMVSCEYRIELDKAQTELQADISKKTSLIDRNNTEIEAVKKDIQNLEGTEHQRQKKVDNADNKKTKKEKKEKLHKTQQVLEDRRAKLLELQYESEIYSNELEQLKNDEKDLKELQEKENRLAPIKDYFHEAISKEVKRWKSDNKEVQEWRNAIARGLSDFSLAREGERQMVFASLSSLNILFSELSMLKGPDWVFGRQAQSVVHLTSEIYQLHDLYKIWSQAQKSLGETLESLRAENPDAGYLDAIHKMGAPLFIGSYLVPSLQMIGAGLSIVRIGKHIYNGSPMPMSNEERRIIQLGEFLSELGKHIDLQIIQLEQNLKEEFHSEISVVRTELGLLAEEVTSEITTNREKILGRLSFEKYDQYTVTIKGKGREIEKKGSVLRLEFEQSNLSSPEQRVKTLTKFLIKLCSDIQHDLDFDVNTGVILGRDSTGKEVQTNFLVDLNHIARNPDIYTGLLASHLDIDKTPSLFLFNRLGENYSLLQNAFSEPPSDFVQLMNQCRGHLQKQGESLQKLIDAYQPTIERVRKYQDRIITGLRRQIQEMQTFGNECEHALLQGVFQRNNHFEELTQEDNLSAHHRFHFVHVLCDTKVTDTYAFQINPNFKAHTEIIGKLSSIFCSTLGITGGLLGGVPGAVLGVKAGSGLASSFTLWSFIHDKTERRRHSKISKFPFSQKKIEHILKQGLEIDDLSGLPALKVSTWINENGRISSRITDYEYEWKRHENGWFKEFSRRGYFGESKFKNSPFRASVYLQPKLEDEGEYSQQVSKISNSEKSPITINEVQQISTAHVVDPDNYKNGVTGLLNDYRDWLVARVQKLACPSGNRFTQIDQQADFVTPSNPILVPLAFPKTLMNVLKKNAEKDLIEMQASGVGTLIPSYSFKYSPKNNCYRLKIAFNFVPRDKGKEKVQFPAITIAEIDEVTVKSFARPVFDKEQEPNEPNLNEFLIQAMYTSFGNSLGLPGDRTISMGGGKWIAPAERPFPGFFKIWNEYPQACIKYDCEKITPEISHVLMNLNNESFSKVEGLNEILVLQSPPKPSKNYVSVWTKLRQGQKTFEERKKKLEENYQLIWSYSCLKSGADDQLLRAKLEQDLGILDPKMFQSFYDVLNCEKSLNPISKKDMDRFNGFLNRYPSDYVSRFNSIMEQLAPVDVKGKGRV